MAYPEGKSWRDYQPTPDKNACLDILRSGGSLTLIGRVYWYGPRKFQKATIASLIAAGDAIRVGNSVVHPDHLALESA